MTVRPVNQDNVLREVTDLLVKAEHRVWVTAPWLTSSASSLFFAPLAGRLAELDVRVVYRLKGADDLKISDLEALDRLAGQGADVRYSNRLHAKLVLIDDVAAVVSSSNLTATAGYSETQGAWQNEELGAVVTDEPGALTFYAEEFEQIWRRSRSVDENTVGIVLDASTSSEFGLVAMRDVHEGEYVRVAAPHAAPSAGADAELVGEVTRVTALNPSVPDESREAKVQFGLPGGGGGQRGVVPDIDTLFGHPSKTHAFLMTQTLVRDSATYRVATVRPLKVRSGDGSWSMATAPPSPGEVVDRASATLLTELVGPGSVPFGNLYANPEVRVAFDADRLLTLHTAVLGMTGAGKSNATKVLLRSLFDSPAGADLRVVVIDTHGEYGGSFGEPQRSDLRVDFRPSVSDPTWVVRACRAGRQRGEVADVVEGVLDSLDPVTSTADDVADALEAEATDASKGLQKRLRLLADAVRSTPGLRLWPGEEVTLARVDGSPFTGWDTPGLYVLDLRSSHGYAERGRRAKTVISSAFRFGKDSDGTKPVLLVIDEAQNYAPEQQTGRLGENREVFDAVFEVASEGRKFNVGLLVASQRPARVNNDVLSQCGTMLVFRMVNMEDLDAVRDSFEAASVSVLAKLPNFDTGVCYAGGAALDMPVVAKVDLFTGL